MDSSFMSYAGFIENSNSMVSFSFMIIEVIQLLLTVMD